MKLFYKWRNNKIMSRFIPVSTKLTLGLSLLFIVVMSIAITTIVVLSSNPVKQSAISALQYEVASKVTDFEQFIQYSKTDVRNLAVLPQFSKIAHLQSIAERDSTRQAETALQQLQQQVERYFTYVIKNEESYIKLRYISASGKELFCIKKEGGEAKIMAPSQLSDEGHFDYFKRAAATPQGQLFVSQIKLYREYGQIQIPHRPTIQLAKPIYDKSPKLQGIVVADIDLTELFHQLSNNHYNAYSFLVDSYGYFIQHPNKQKEWGGELESKVKIHTTHPTYAQNIISGKAGGLLTSDNRLIVYDVIYPIPARRDYFVSLFYEIDASIFFQLNQQITINSLLAAIGVIGIIIIVFYVFVRNVTRPIKTLLENVSIMGEGNFAEEMTISTNDEFGHMANAFNALNDNRKKILEFAEYIGRGELSSEVDFKAEGALGNALLTMRNSLQKAKEDEEKRKEDDRKRNWITHGLAKLGDVLRQKTENIDDLSFNVIKLLVDYLKASQGGVFVYNDEDKDDVHLHMAAAIAFNQRKFFKKKVLPREGLIGMSILEKKTTYMTEIPENYITITSGLGEGIPRSLLIVPLMFENAPQGVIEIASLKKLEPHHIDFVEKAAETVAATFANVKINEQTAKLLEQSQYQSEQMVSQEEEMRQNMEELIATQEESDRREQDLREELKNAYAEIDHLQNKLKELIG